MNRTRIAAATAMPVLVLLAGVSLGKADEPGPSAAWAPAVEPKPLSENVKQGLAWLVKMQQSGGGWSQGEESAHMGASGEGVRDMANVGDTCAAALALIRAGSTPGSGEYAQNIRKAIAFICGKIEATDADSLSVTDVQNTRLQMKLGAYIDTFLAALVLAEVKDRMPDESSARRVAAALAKVTHKIEKNQRPDGTWDNRGWAPALQQAMASKAVNRVAQAGGAVDEQVRGRAEDYARRQYDEKADRADAVGSAGVELYAMSAALGAMQDSDNTNEVKERELRQQIASAPSEAAAEPARALLRSYAGNKDELKDCQDAIIKRLDDERFMAGFGSNGGEEFLSYMNIGESLVVKGGDEWKAWDKSIAQNLNRIQNDDGSWTGHHCITGRTFCTSAALLVLTVDRAPVPLAAKMGRR